MSRQRIESNRNRLNRNELIFNSSSTNSSNFSGINNNNAILKNNEISSSVDLPDETVSFSSGGSSSIHFDRYNNNKTKRKNNNNFNFGIDKSSDSSEKSINTMTVSDLDTRTSQNQSDLKLLRKKFIKFILREDTYSLVMFF